MAKGFTRRCRQIGAWLAGVLLMIIAIPALGEEPGSQSADRDRIVAITRALEANPLDSRLYPERAWAIGWLKEDPDIVVSACAAPLGGMVGTQYPYGPDIVAQYILGMTELILTRPETADDVMAQQIAGVESALAAYRAILKIRPRAQSAELDAILAAETRGELEGFVRGAYARCNVNKAAEEAVGAPLQ